jgi:Trk K+ transport system NAD-binding subunit
MGSASRLRRERAAARQKQSAPTSTRVHKQAKSRDSLRARLSYAFDNSMARGPSALIWYLGAAVLAIVLGVALLVWIFGVGPNSNPITVTYQAFLHAIDTGTIAGDSGTGYILFQLIVTIGGIFIFSAFIGVIANAIDARLTELRRGRSLVLESGHTLILGWSESIFTVISELALANESRTTGACVVVLANEDKPMMDDEVRTRLKDLSGTKVVCRTGSPTTIADLELVNHAEARSVILLRPEGEDPDMYVIKALLALTHTQVEGRHIVAEIADRRHLDAARVAGKGEAEVIDRGSIASRLLVQTSRQSGAARIYEDLFDFDGHEIYARQDAALVGKTYGDALLAYEECALIGFQQDGGVSLNPPASTPIPEGAELLAIAEDDSVFDAAAASGAVVDESVIVEATPRIEPAEKTLLLGWNDQTATVLQSLDDFAPDGSSAEIVALAPPDQDWLQTAAAGFERLTVSARMGDSADVAVLEALDLDRFDRVIVMCEVQDDHDRSDGRVLLSLIQLREIQRRTGAKFSLVSELMDEADRDLAEVARVDDVVISEQVISFLLAQISENRSLALVFDELLKADGSEVYLRPVSDYVRADGELSFATIVASGRRRNETVIGYRFVESSRDPHAHFGIELNPPKSELIVPAEGDSVIVLAED